MASRYPKPIGDIPSDKLVDGVEYFVVYGNKSFPSFLRFKLDKGVIWGHSIWKGNSGYRTLGINFEEWAKRNDLNVFFDDVKLAVNYMEALLSIPLPQ